MADQHPGFLAVDRRKGGRTSMTGRPRCYQITLLILLLVIRATFANHPSLSSASSTSSSPSSSSSTSSAPSSSSTPTSAQRQDLSTSSSSPSSISSSLLPSSPQSSRESVDDIAPHNLISSDKSPSSSLSSSSSTTQPISSSTTHQSDSGTPNMQYPNEGEPTDLSLSLNNIKSRPATDGVQRELSTATLTKDSSATKRSKFEMLSTEKQKLILNTLEKMFLKNAGLKKRPRISKDHAVPEYMLNLYKAKVEGPNSGPNTYLKMKGNGLIAANTVRSFLHTDTSTSHCQPPLCARVHFDVSNIPNEEVLAAAELRVFVDSSSLSPDTASSRRSGTPDPNSGTVGTPRSAETASTHRLEVHEILHPASPDGDVISRLLDTHVIKPDVNSSWHSFDIHPAVLKWKRGPSKNHGLEIRLVSKKPILSTGHHIRLRRSAELTTSQWAVERPIVVIFTNDDTSLSSSSESSSGARLRRRKRNTNTDDSDDTSKSNKRKNRKRRRKNRKRKKKKRRRKKKGNKDFCQRHPLYVDFTDVGWTDWIVAPKGYRADYCGGQCMAPMPYFFKASNHAMLQARVYKVNPSAVPMVCCVPIKMVPITMLYRDEKGSIVMKNYDDMSVEECGCK